MSSIKGFKEVFSKPLNIVFTLFLGFLFYMLSVVISDFSDLAGIFRNYNFLLTVKLLPLYFTGFPKTIPVFAAFSLVFISLLFGSYIVMAIYKTKKASTYKKHSIFWSIGIFFGILAPGCAACGLGAATLLGLGGFIVTLPFHGLEASFIALLLLGYANWNVAGKIGLNVCPSNSKYI